MDDNIAYQLHGNCYLNITSRCTLRCEFCPKFQGSWEVQGYELRMRREPSADAIIEAIGNPSDYSEFVFCGLGEPTIRWGTLLAIAEHLEYSLTPIRVNTDGLANLVHGRDVTPEMAGRIDSLSISMNAQDASTYDRHCRPKRHGAFDAMLEFAQLSANHVPEVNLTALDGLEGVDIDACERLANKLGLGFRRRILGKVG